MASDQPTIPALTVESSPHVHQRLTTRRVMIDVLIALVPAVVAGIYYFRLNAVVLIVACCVAGLVTEALFNRARHKPNSLGDCSAIVTGVILALSLPSAFPWWAAAIGMVVAIGLGKMVYGGLGHNVFNPAMVGRAFLMACFPVLMTTWAAPAGGPCPADAPPPAVAEARTTGMVAADAKTRAPRKLSPAEASTDAVTQATPLQMLRSRRAAKTKGEARAMPAPDLADCFLGRTGGCMGETCTLALLIGALYLLVRRAIPIEIPVSILVTVILVAGITHTLDPVRYPDPLIAMTTGGLILGAFFIATDPVSCPLPSGGRWLFGFGVGALVMLIRLVGGYPEGVMYAVLLMNAVAPLLSRWTRPTPLGGHARA